MPQFSFGRKDNSDLEKTRKLLGDLNQRFLRNESKREEIALDNYNLSGAQKVLDMYAKAMNEGKEVEVPAIQPTENKLPTYGLPQSGQQSTPPPKKIRKPLDDNEALQVLIKARSMLAGYGVHGQRAQNEILQDYQLRRQLKKDKLSEQSLNQVKPTDRTVIDEQGNPIITEKDGKQYMTTIKVDMLTGKDIPNTKKLEEIKGDKEQLVDKTITDSHGEPLLKYNRGFTLIGERKRDIKTGKDIPGTERWKGLNDPTLQFNLSSQGKEQDKIYIAEQEEAKTRGALENIKGMNMIGVVAGDPDYIKYTFNPGIDKSGNQTKIPERETYFNYYKRNEDNTALDKNGKIVELPEKEKTESTREYNKRLEKLGVGEFREETDDEYKARIIDEGFGKPNEDVQKWMGALKAKENAYKYFGREYIPVEKQAYEVYLPKYRKKTDKELQNIISKAGPGAIVSKVANDILKERKKSGMRRSENKSVMSAEEYLRKHKK